MATEKSGNKPYLIRYRGGDPPLDRKTQLALGKNRNGKPSLPDVSAHERLFRHSTMNSARRSASYRPPDWVPNDRLDFVMESMYDPLENTFPEKGDPYVHVSPN